MAAYKMGAITRFKMYDTYLDFREIWAISKKRNKKWLISYNKRCVCVCNNIKCTQIFVDHFMQYTYF